MQQIKCPLLVLLISILASTAAARALLSTTENLDLLAGVEIPAKIGVPSGNKVILVWKGKGYQHYEFNGTQWVLKNATAKLYGSRGAFEGRHFFLPEPDVKGGQPTWQSVDHHAHHVSRFSAVTAKGVAAISVDHDSITWNLLQATSHSGNTEVPLGHVTYVQRLKTRHGLAPSTTNGVNKGDTHSSKYTAIYAFYVQST